VNYDFLFLVGLELYVHGAFAMLADECWGNEVSPADMNFCLIRKLVVYEFM